MTRFHDVYRCCVLLFAGLSAEAAEEFSVAIVDFHGLGGMSRDEARAALAIAEGDTFATGDLAFIRQSEQRLAELPGVRKAKLALVCCTEGKMIVWAGVQRTDAPILTFRDPPTGDALLAPEIVASVRRMLAALPLAMKAGRNADDSSAGHSLFADPAMRAEQERFIEFARESGPLRTVLHTSADAEHRAIAAQVIAYTERKSEVVGDLLYAIDDPDETVRNNATRALMMMAQATRVTPPAIPVRPFIRFLYSLTWTDLNKSSGLLEALTRKRDPSDLELLRREAMNPLIEMARWKSHGEGALRIVGRMAGMTESEIEAARVAGNSERVIQAALALRN
jgi:hypothetical protein